MAKTAMNFLRELKNNYPQLLYIYGQEDILAEEIIKRYVDKLKVDQFNFIRIDTANVDIDELEQLIYSPPLFLKDRLVVFDDFGTVFKKQALQKEFLSLLENITESSSKIILNAGQAPDKRLKLYKELKKIAVIVESKQLTINEQYQWLRRELKRRKIFMSRNVEQEFLLQVGGSLRDLSSELDKIVSYKDGSNGVVSVEEVIKVVSPSIESSIFRCVDALGQKNIKVAMEELEKLWTASEPPLKVLAMIVRQMRLLYKTKLLMNQNASSSKFRRELGVPNFVSKKLQDQSHNFSLKNLKNKLMSLRSLEKNVKTGKIDASYAIELWVLGYE